MLNVAMPVLKQNDAPGSAFVSEKPIQLECAPVKFPDGAPVKPEDVIQVGFFTQRHHSTGVIERWDEIGKQWTLSSSVNPQPLFYKDNMWQAVIVAVGQKDQAEQDKFSTDRIVTFPRYSVQCVFQARDEAKQEHGGSSLTSVPVQISALGGKDRAGLYMKPKMEPSSAKEIGMFLKDAGLTEQGKF